MHPSNKFEILWQVAQNLFSYSPVSKNSIKTKAVLTMTDMTESTELQAFKRPKGSYKVTVKISLRICVVLS